MRQTMSYRILVSVFAALAWIALIPGKMPLEGGATNAPGMSPARPGEILVRWSDHAAATDRAAVAASVGGQSREIGLAALGVSLITFDRVRFQSIQPAARAAGNGSRLRDDASDGPTVEQIAADQVAARPLVDWAEPSYRYALAQADVTPSDPAFTQQQPGLRRHGFPAAWALARGAGVRVAVLDTGVDCRHPDLKASCDPGFDYVDGAATSGSHNGDAHGHGTHVASVVCAATDNGFALAGAGWGCRVADHRVADGDGMVDTAWAARALVALVDDPRYRAEIANMSFGGPSSSRTLAAAASYAERGGVILVAAAGNDGSSRSNFPCGYREVLCVGAVDAAGRRAWFSNTGHHAVSAVGVAVPGAYRGSDRTVQMSGTSQASPHAAGALALVEGYLAQRGEHWAPERVRQLVVDSAEDLGEIGADPVYGNGLVRPDLALERLARQLGPGIPETTATVPGPALVSPTSTSRAAPTSTPRVSPTSTRHIGPTGTRPAPFGTAVFIEPRAGEIGWVVSSHPDQNAFADESHVWAGVHRGDRYLGALRLWLDAIPPGTKIAQARLELTGLTAAQLGSGGQWSVALLAGEIESTPFDRLGYRELGPAAVASWLLPIVGPVDLGAGRQNVFDLDDAQLALLQARLGHDQPVTLRIDGPAGGGATNLFAWDSGQSSGSHGQGPRLVTGYTMAGVPPAPTLTSVPSPSPSPQRPSSTPSASRAPTSTAAATPIVTPVERSTATPDQQITATPDLPATVGAHQTRIAETATHAAGDARRTRLVWRAYLPTALRRAVKPEACWPCRR